MGKPTATWKSDETAMAAKFTEALKTVEEYAHECKRIPLSGSNNRRTDGTAHHGDISFPDEYDLHVELKRRKSFAHQTLFDTAAADAAKHGHSNTILITKQLRQRGFTAMIDADLLFRLLSLPGAREVLKFGKPPVPPQSGTPSGSVEKRSRKRRTKQANQDLSEDRGQDQGSTE